MRRLDVERLDDPRLAPYRTLRRPEEHRRAGIFVAEGGPVVERLLRSTLEVESLLVTGRWLEALAPHLEARGDGPAVHVAAEALLREITGFEYHQGALAVGRLPPERALADVVAAAARPRLVVALDGVTWPDNLGVIARSAAALGASALLVGETAASPWLRRAVRISMGAVLAVPVVHSSGLAGDLSRLAALGFRVAGADLAGATSLERYAFGDDACIVLGHEWRGLSPAVRAACADLVAVPMRGGVDSLNVAAAASVFLWEFARQRGR